MKRVLTLIITAFFFISLNAQMNRKGSSDTGQPNPGHLSKDDLYTPSAFRVDSSRTFGWNSVAGDWLAIPDSRILYEYDSQGHPVVTLYYQWSAGQNNWINQEKDSLVWDDKGNNTEWFSNQWNTQSGSWIPVEHDSNTFNDQNIMIRGKWYYYDTNTSIWFLGDDSRYNEKGILIEETSYYWNESTFQIEGGEKFLESLNSFDESDTTLVLELNISTGEWTNERLYLEFYDSDHNHIMQIASNWVNNSWELASKTLYAFTDGLITEELTKVWSQPTWEDYLRTTYTYDLNRRKTGILREYWMNNSWVLNNVYVFKYDTAGNLVENSYQRYDLNTGIIASGYHDFYEYNNNNLKTQRIDQIWSKSSEDWINSTKTNYFYSSYQGIYDGEFKNGYCSFENPYPIGSPINCPSLEANKTYKLMVFSLSGAMVFTCYFKGQHTVTIDRPLTPGIYIVQVTEGNDLIFRSKVALLE